ncbi:carboxymuconolactone decarboxylase family protein [Pseudooceanicola sp. CBS1P-1]|uniref:Carboxymuconolactone decarboxylase family protein n=1 Tax=Pseudooceanicola albus TaxID=2692189 RepID=A0A6L7G1G4_9RHOB|nr:MULTISPECIES: carboxymuconolactone decarboxylase family protein [Pseudooceanicola]MBT9383492.1 carboxymuconolactone decarboxylase family protein [Pseudooceanicola endophyticus]MXN17348.1 carboxymuconolactone decarboxylase family protein [Pseudooceanicola albus]
MTETAIERGRRLSEQFSPGMEATLEARYGHLLPDMASSVVSYVYGQHYARPGLALRDRYLATIAALAAQGDQTAAQLKINIAAGLKAGLAQREIAEVIWQMALYGGLPASINALNTSIAVFSEQDALIG